MRTPRRPSSLLAIAALMVLGIPVGMGNLFARVRPAANRHQAKSASRLAGRGVVYSFGVVGTGFGPKILRLGHAVPVKVQGLPPDIVQIATSNSDTYALSATGAVWAFGAGSTGELGNGTTTSFTSVPVKVHLPLGVRIASLANPMPYDSALAIDTHHQVYGWGFNWRSTLCLAHTDVLVPTLLPLSQVSLATGAGAHSLFDAGGHVYACGRNSAGELGNGTTKDATTPTQVVGLPHEPVRALVSSWQGSGALMANGSYYDWGYNAGGQLGDGSTINSSVPVKVALPAPVSQVSQGGSQPTNGQSLALLSNGTLWAWGDGSYGQLGNGSTSGSSLPVRVHLPDHVAIRQVFSGGDSSYAIASGGQLWVWGGNLHGQLGDGAHTPLLEPTPLRLHLDQISATATNVAGLAVRVRS
jgi:alpha-tubulin suppressor-like RCC1 family protein